MRIRHLAIFSAAVLAGALTGSLVGPRPADAVARELIELQRASAFKNEVPRVIRPDILLNGDGITITELDSVPGGIGLTAWLNETYAEVQGPRSKVQRQDADATVIGGADGASAEVATRADFRLSLSFLTFTHEMARVVMLEQLYRAYTIIKGFPYQK